MAVLDSPEPREIQLGLSFVGIANHNTLMKSRYYPNMFDPSTGLMRERLSDGSWVKDFNDAVRARVDHLME